MKVAFATTDGINVDEHFGRAGIFAVYELTPEDYRFVELRKFADALDTAIEEQGARASCTTTGCSQRWTSWRTARLSTSPKSAVHRLQDWLKRGLCL